MASQVLKSWREEMGHDVTPDDLRKARGTCAACSRKLSYRALMHANCFVCVCVCVLGAGVMRAHV